MPMTTIPQRRNGRLRLAASAGQKPMKPSRWQKISAVISKISDDDILSQSAALAYYTAFAMAPLLLLAISLMALLPLDMQNNILQQVRDFMGPHSSQILGTIIDGAEARSDLRSAAGWISAFVLAISASVVFAQLQSTLNLIFRVKPGQNKASGFFGSTMSFLRRRLFSVGILLAFLFVAIVSLAVSSALSYFFQLGEVTSIRTISIALNLVIFSLLFALIYKWVPDRYVRAKSSLVAGAATSFLFVFGKELISVYLGEAAIGSAYGAAGSLLVFLAWIYYSSLIFFVGAEIASMFWIIDEKPKSRAQIP